MKTVCIYHSIDLDGQMSAAIVKLWHNQQRYCSVSGQPLPKDYAGSTPMGGLTLSEDCTFIGYNYGQPIPDLSDYDKVIDLRKIELLEEKWIVINEYDSKFSISNWGRLKSNEYIVKNNNGYRKIKGKILSQCINPDYPSVATNYGKLYIHRLVAKYFINNHENKLTVNHKDGVKTNNIITNLEWNTYKENQQHSILNGLRNTGINNKRNIAVIKVDDNKIETKYPSLTIAASENNLHISNIARALKDGIKCGEFNWKYDIQTPIEYNNQEIINMGSIVSSCTIDNLSILEMIWKYFFPNEQMPEIVRLLGRYDCFGHKTKSFEMSNDGYDKAKQYLKEVGQLKEFEDNHTSIDGYSLVHYANDVAKLLSEEQKVLEFQYGARQCISNYEEAYRELCDNIYTEHSEYKIWQKGKAIYQYLCTEAKQVYSTKSSMIFYNESLTKLDFYTYIEDDGDMISIRIHDKGENFSGVLYLYKDSQNSAYIANIYVREDLRRQGLGTNLIKNIEDYAVKRNITDISLRVEPNTFIHHWYLKLGYSYCKHDINTNLIWMKKDLPIVRFIAINRERFNPINFGIDYHADGYDGVVSFHYDGSAKLWRYSLYNDNGKVDCSAIAKQFGGGGHFSASGFICDNNTFLQIIGDK